MSHPKIERRFVSFPEEMSMRQLEDTLKRWRFKLGTFTTDAGATRYGINAGSLEEWEGDQRKQGVLNKVGGIISARKEKLSFLTS